MRFVGMSSRWLIVALLIGTPAWAQEPGAVSPYAGLETRDIKAIGPDEIAAYENGDGMRYALAAELNRYPGPKHVLELADDLELSSEQRARTEEIFHAMRESARDPSESSPPSASWMRVLPVRRWMPISFSIKPLRSPPSKASSALPTWRRI